MREMKDSGIQWIGKIPLEWMIVSTKFLFTIMSGATPESTKPQNWDGNIKWITPADYKTKDIYVGDGRRNLSQTGFDSCSTNMVPKGSIIFSKRAPIGSVAISSADLCTNQGCLSCITKGTTFVKFYYYVMSIATEQYELLAAVLPWPRQRGDEDAVFLDAFGGFLHGRILSHLKGVIRERMQLRERNLNNYFLLRFRLFGWRGLFARFLLHGFFRHCVPPVGI